MCTVIIHVPHTRSEPIRLVAMRDEDPGRAWDPLGSWWQEAPSVIGVRDRRAGGAWLAIDRDRPKLAVIMNRPEPPQHTEPLESRGTIVLSAVQGRWSAEVPRTASFNLLEVESGSAIVTTWDNRETRTEALAPGTHMIAHSDADDLSVARIARWLPEFQTSSEEVDGESTWQDRWERIIRESSQLPPTDDEAIVRDNRRYGVNTFTLYGVMVEIGADGVEAWHAKLDEPAQWGEASFEPLPKLAG